MASGSGSGSGSNSKNYFRQKWDKDKYEKMAQKRHTEERDKKDGKVVPPVKREMQRHRDYMVDILESELGKLTIVFTKTTSQAEMGSYYCNGCHCVVKDSINSLDHINSKKHQRNLGMSTRVERSSLDQVKKHYENNKKKMEEKQKEYDFEERMKELREEEEKAKMEEKQKEYDFEERMKELREEEEKAKMEEKQKEYDFEERMKELREEEEKAKMEEKQKEYDFEERMKELREEEEKAKAYKTEKQKERKRRAEEDVDFEEDDEMDAVLGFSGFGSAKKPH